MLKLMIMKKDRRHYDQEFKKMAVELVESGKSTTEVGKDLGIKPDLVRRWRREFKTNEKGCFSGNGIPNLTPEQREILALRKKLKDTELERDILKKAVSIFSASDSKSTSL